MAATQQLPDVQITALTPQEEIIVRNLTSSDEEEAPASSRGTGGTGSLDINALLEAVFKSTPAPAAAAASSAATKGTATPATSAATPTPAKTASSKGVSVRQQLGAQLSTTPLDANATSAIAQANADAAAVRIASQEAIAGITEQQVRKGDAVNNLLTAIDREAAAKGVIAQGVEDKADADLQRRIAAFAPSSKLINDSISKSVELTKLYAQQADELTALEQDDSFVGRLKQAFSRDAMARNLNETVDAVDRQKAIRQSLVAAGDEVTKFQLSLVPTKTPAQRAAEAELLATKAQEERAKIVIADAGSIEQNFNNMVQLHNNIASSSAGSAAQAINISHTQFAANNAAILAAKQGILQLSAWDKQQGELGGEEAVYKKIATHFSIDPSSAKAWFNLAKMADNSAAVAMLQASHSGQAVNAKDLAKAYNYAPPGSISGYTAAMNEVILSPERDAEFSKWLGSKGNKNMLIRDSVAFEKADPDIKNSLSTAFNNSPVGEIPLPAVNAKVSDLAAMIERTVPTGSIPSPPVVDAATGQTTTPAPIRLKETGEVGLHLKMVEGTGTEAFAWLLSYVDTLKTPKDKAQAVKKFTNFFSNVITVNNTFRGNERAMYNIGLAKTFKAQVTIPGFFKAGVGEKKVIDLADYQTVLREASPSFIGKMSEAANRVPTQEELNNAQNDLLGAPR